MSPPDQTPETTPEVWNSPSRLVLIGAGVVGLCSLLTLGFEAPNAAAILVPAAVVAAISVTRGRERIGEAGSAALLMIAAAVVAVLSLLNLIAVLTELDDLAGYGSIAGLLVRLAIAGGGGVLVVAALGVWRDAGIGESRNQIERPERIAAIGGLVVVGAWALMLVSVWNLTTGHAFGVAAATAALAVVYVHARDTLPLSTMSRRTAILCLAALTLFVALASLVDTIGDWGFIVDFGGLGMLLPYLAYLAGAAVLGAAAVMLGLAIKESRGDIQPGHLAALAAVGLVSFLAFLASLDDGAGGDVQPSAAEESTSSTDQTPVSTPEETGEAVVAGHDIPPLNGCQLLTTSEIEEALGLTDLQGMFSVGGAEACTWQPNVDGGSEDDLLVRISPGNQEDLVPGAERDGVEGVPVPDVGALAVWFEGEGRGSLAVVDTAEVGYTLFEIEVARPDADDAIRLDAAKNLAASALTALKGETIEPVEAVLCDLVTDEEAEEILAPLRVGRPAAGDRFAVIGSSAPTDLTGVGNESCQKLILVEIYVEVATGSLSDFDPGARLEGITGESVEGVGDEAVWFADVPVEDSLNPPQGAGVLAVRSGQAFFRIGLRLPEVDFADQLETAKELASKAVIRVAAGDAEVITIERDPPDHSGRDFVGNLLAKEEAGEWTRGEGLVATLKYIVGEADAGEVLLQPDLSSDEATGIVNMAYLYLADGPDPAIADEISRLLGQLVFSNEQLEEMAGVEGPTASLPRYWAVEDEVEPGDSANTCQDFFAGWQIPAGLGSCLEMRTPEALEESHPGLYRVFGPAPPLPTAGWEDRHYDLTVAAMEEIVPVFDELGELPPVNVVFSVVDDAKALAVAAPKLGFAPESQTRPCGVALFTSMQSLSELNFKQVVAHELAHCLHGHTFPGQYSNHDRAMVNWWDEGLAEHLSSVVNDDYAKNNFEHDQPLDDFNASEIATGVLDRQYGNFIFFQHLASSNGDAGVFDIIASFPADGNRENLEASLAARGGMAKTYHDFVRKVTDIQVEDKGGGFIPAVPDSWAMTLDGPTHIFDNPLPFGVTRLALEVPNGMVACIEEDKGTDILSSSRSGRPGIAGSWSDGVPDVLSGEVVVVVTTTKPEGEYTLSVNEVSEDPDCDDDDSEVDPPDVECLDFCDPSDYYRVVDQITQELFSLLSGQ